MDIKYNSCIKDNAIVNNLKRLVNQTYKLLPMREEENEEWQKLLVSIIEEFAGMNELFLDHHETLFCLLCKLEGMILLTQEKDFFLFRKTIFECLGLINNLINICH